MLRTSAVLVSALLCASAAFSAKPIPGTKCTPFPADSWWQADISKLPVHAKSKVWTSNMSPQLNIWPDFGPSYGAIPGPYGIPISVVKAPRTFVPVKFFYSTESDRVKYPLGSDTKVEGWQWRTGDRHTITVYADTCRLYETWATVKGSGTIGWEAGSGATWSLKSNALRPIYWTSADAAGLPILPGLLRQDEVAALNIGHAIRFTTNQTGNGISWPARHRGGTANTSSFPPMGARFRLKKSYVINAKLRPDTKAVLTAMKKYGIVLADVGQPWYFQGEASTKWNQQMLDELKKIPAAYFEAVDTSSLKISNDSMQVKPPQ